MELPFYLMSLDTPGSSWEGLVSLHGDGLHFALKAGEGDQPTEFDVPLDSVMEATFERGLVSRKVCLRVGDPELRERFPVGVTGQEVHLMVARHDPDFASGPNTEEEFEALVCQIAQRCGPVSPPSSGLVS